MCHPPPPPRLHAFVLVQVTTTATSARGDSQKFELRSNPPHWYLCLDGQYCDQLGRSMIFMTIIEALEAEGWKMKGSNAITNEELMVDNTKLFFVRDRDA